MKRTFILSVLIILCTGAAAFAMDLFIGLDEADRQENLGLRIFLEGRVTQEEGTILTCLDAIKAWAAKNGREYVNTEVTLDLGETSYTVWVKMKNKQGETEMYTWRVFQDGNVKSLSSRKVIDGKIILDHQRLNELFLD